MNRLEEYIDILTDEYHRANPKGPKLKLYWRKKTVSERYSITYGGGTLFLHGESPLGAVLGLSFAKSLSLSGHIGEYSGDHSPLFSFRPLYVKGLSGAKLFSDETLLERVCQKILLFGYNALLFEIPYQELSRKFLQSLEEKVKVFRDFGVKVLLTLQLHKEPIDNELLDQVLSLVSSVSPYLDYLFWEALICRSDPPSINRNKDLLQAERAKQEILKLQAALGGNCRLIYYIPSSTLQQAERESRWILKLSNEIPDSTLIAFSSRAGDPTHDFLPPHPIWKQVRLTNYPHRLNLLPIVNIGLVGQGDGFWPCLTFDLFRHHLARCREQTVKGMVALTSYLPNEHTLLACNLWLGSQLQWEKRDPSLLAETWFSAFLPEWPPSFMETWFAECHEIVVKLREIISYLRGDRLDLSLEEARSLTEYLLARLKYLHTKLHQLLIPKKTAHPTIKDYLIFFVRDAKRLLFRYLQHCQMPTINMMNEEDTKEAFWTTMTGHSKFTSSSLVTLLDAPQQGAPGSVMRKIYDDVNGVV